MITTGQPVLYRSPAIFERLNGFVAAESTRHGGISPTPFASLNLGINTTDDPANVDENRRRFFEAIGTSPAQFAHTHQVHGTEVLRVAAPGRYEGYDALITSQPGLLIGVTVADCVPILICDAQNQAVAAVHAGWRGTAGGIVTKTLETMRKQFGTAPARCYTYVGTAIDELAFAVGPEVAAQFAPTLTPINPTTGQTCVDLKRANVAQLLAPPAQIEVSPYSTVRHNADYFSYRHDGGQTGRMLAVVGWMT